VAAGRLTSAELDCECDWREAPAAGLSWAGTGVTQGAECAESGLSTPKWVQTATTTVVVDLREAGQGTRWNTTC